MDPRDNYQDRQSKKSTEIQRLSLLSNVPSRWAMWIRKWLAYDPWRRRILVLSTTEYGTHGRWLEAIHYWKWKTRITLLVLTRNFPQENTMNMIQNDWVLVSALNSFESEKNRRRQNWFHNRGPPGIIWTNALYGVRNPLSSSCNLIIEIWMTLSSKSIQLFEIQYFAAYFQYGLTCRRPGCHCCRSHC